MRIKELKKKTKTKSSSSKKQKAKRFEKRGTHRHTQAHRNGESVKKENDTL
jgi:hypothetical protein